MTRKRTLDPKLIGPNTPLRLSVAAEIAYPDGSMTASGLRREAKKKRLVIERTAGKDYTTLAAIDKMREQCRAQPKEPDCGSNRRLTPKTVKSAGTRPGSSATERVKSARAALEMTAKGLNARSPSISPASIGQIESADVIPLKSSS